MRVRNTREKSLETHELLTKLSNDNQLKQINHYLNQFNMFQVTGIENSEIKHSNVLGWLLDSKGNHGLEGRILNDWMTKLKINVCSCNDFIVEREWENIDLLLISNERKTVIVIEHKISAQESPYQLDKYKQIVDEKFGKSNYTQIFFYLSPDGRKTLNDSYEVWRPIKYETLIDTVDSVIELEERNIGLEVSVFIQQYCQYVRRKIMRDTELEGLCLDVYYSNKDAIDKIIKVIAQLKTEVQQKIEDILNKNERIISNGGGKIHGISRFTTTKLNSIKSLTSSKENTAWAGSNRLILFETKVDIENQEVLIELVLACVGSTKGKKIINLCKENKELFNKIHNQSKWPRLYSKVIEYNTVEKLLEEYEKFLNSDLTKIEEFFITNKEKIS